MTLFREILLHTESDNELYEWMQALTHWQNIRPQDTRSTMPMVKRTHYAENVMGTTLTVTTDAVESQSKQGQASVCRTKVKLLYGIQHAVLWHQYYFGSIRYFWDCKPPNEIYGHQARSKTYIYWFGSTETN